MALDQRPRQLPLEPHELAPVRLELVGRGAAGAQLLALGDERADPAVDVVDVCHLDEVEQTALWSR